MDIQPIEAASILTPQKSGFLASAPYPFTHALSPYLGCAYGSTTCGLFCYAQHLPNWTNRRAGAAWGALVSPKRNAAALLDETLRRMRPERRAATRIFMATTTDPYQPVEASERITRGCLEVFARYPDLDLLVVQTRGPLVARDLDLLAGIPYAWLSMTVETDDPSVYKRLKGGPSPRARLDVVRAAVAQRVRTQVAVSPCMPYTEGFADTLLECGAARVVVDTVLDGDGSGGRRTGHSPYAAIPGWDDTAMAHRLYDTLAGRGPDVGWSTSGFCGISPRNR